VSSFRGSEFMDLRTVTLVRVYIIKIAYLNTFHCTAKAFLFNTMQHQTSN